MGIIFQVRNGVRYTEPVDLSQIAALPDFMLVPKHLEQDFCQESNIDKIDEPTFMLFFWGSNFKFQSIPR